MESGHRKLDYGTPTDDDEVTLPPHDRAKEVPDFPDTDIRDRQTLLDTQREDWLLPTEPLHGPCPRQAGRERPSVIEDRPPLEATGGVIGRKPDQTPLVSPGRQILMEEEVITPPRGGGRPAHEPQGSPRGVRAVPNKFPEDRPRDSGLDRQKDIGSLVDMLVDTELNKTPGRESSLENAGHPTSGRRSRQQKCHGSTEQLVGNNIDRCLTLLCGQITKTMIQQHCNCSLIWRGTR